MALRDLFKKKKPAGATVVGLDGVPYTLVRKFAADGTWPFLAELAKAGALHQMKVTLPEISAVSWPSFMTGQDPGVHGIFGFTELGPNYAMRFTNFGDLKAPTFWDLLGRRGKKSVVINQPGTYPARDIPGVLISGFVAIELNKAVRPLKNLALLRRANYEIDIDTQRCRKDHNQLFIELDRTLEGRRAVAKELWKEAEWDYFQVVITGTDRLQHYLWSAVEDSAHPRHGQAIDYYRKIDAFIKETWERHHATIDVSAEGEGFYLLSDHGFCGIEKEVYVNAWLREHGWLKFEKDEPAGLAELSADAKAFGLDPGRIYVHRAGKYPKGQVGEAEAPALLAQIKEAALALRHDGRPVIELALERHEAYVGPEAKNGPDLVLVPHHGFDLKGQTAPRDVFGKSDLTGMHTWDDAFFWASRKQADDLDITQLARIVTSTIGGIE